IEMLKTRGFVDPARMAVSGWSYGGYMTTWLIGHYHVWETAGACALVTYWTGNSHLAHWDVLFSHEVGGSPWTGDVEKVYRAQSPITYAPQSTTPTLILADTGDVRVPITQSYKLYHALRDNNVPVQFIAYPIAGHSPNDPVRQQDVNRRWIEWLEKYLPPPATSQKK